MEYVVRKAEEFGQPVAINLSFGNVYGSHRGNSLLENYIDMLSDRGRNVIVAGTGNEGNTGGHFSGRLRDRAVSVSNSGDEDMWKKYPSGTSGDMAFDIPATDRFASGVSTAGSITTGNSAIRDQTRIEFLINDFETAMNLQLWKNYADAFGITITHTNGRSEGPF
ncbi:MAG: hypothetical protein LIP11_17540 [Clostridiales bacterium]|nr:hypothetical protein [Clostridiales bacterium]